MKQDKIHNRHSIRLKGYDYSKEGLYFITICTKNRLCLFGKILVGAKYFSPDENDQTNAKHFSPDDNNNQTSNAKHFSINNCIDVNLTPHKIELTELGEIAQQCWLDIPKHFPQIKLHEFIIMPNHIHGIIEIIGANENYRAKDISPLQNGTSQTIGSVIRGFKIGVTNWIRNKNHDSNQSKIDIWQRNYYEHIIRNQQSYDTISNYILNNPKNWNTDKFFANKKNPYLCIEF